MNDQAYKETLEADVHPSARRAGDPRFAVTMLLWLAPGGRAAIEKFQQDAAALFKHHDLRVERQLLIRGKGQIVGENSFLQPDLIQRISLPSPAAFSAYVADPLYRELAVHRDAGIRRLTAAMGEPVLGQETVRRAKAVEERRLYGVGLVRFARDGASAMDEFNRQAEGLYARHGMHIESSMDVEKVLTPIGEADHMAPHRVVMFFLEDASALPGYLSDPDYLRLAPLRDNGLERYDVFFGSVTSPDQPEHASRMEGTGP